MGERGAHEGAKLDLGSGPGLYVHVPFCARACPYCDFDFEVGPHGARQEQYLAALAAELETRAPDFAARGRAGRPQFDTVYLGGGTPSALGAQGLRVLFDTIDMHVDRATAREVTVELNPEHVDDALLDALAASGVSRVSLGVQSFAAPGLAQLGRVHAVAQAIAATAACTERFATSVDLIVGWPGQSRAQLEASLRHCVEAGVEHISVYGLTIEAGSAWPKLVRRGQREMPDEERQAQALEHAAELLASAGYEHYEVASYARPGRAALHNQKYWLGIDVLAVGPSGTSAQHGAAGDPPGAVRRRRNPRGLTAWAGGEAPDIETLAGEDAAGEAAWLGLRRLAGLDLATLERRFAGSGIAPRGWAEWLEARAPRAFARGNLRWVTAERLAFGPGRWMWHDEVAEELV